MNKVCTKCKIEKEFSYYYKHQKIKDGRTTICKECIVIQRATRKPQRNAQRKIHRDKNRDKLNKYARDYYNNNKNKIKGYIEKRKPEINKRLKERRKHDIGFKIRDNLRRRISSAIKNNSKSKSTIKLLGCDIEFLKKHLEDKFTEGMNWGNYGFYGWHIDHKIPCAHFNLAKASEQKKCFHYTNLQPLWAIDNILKRDKIQ